MVSKAPSSVSSSTQRHSITAAIALLVHYFNIDEAEAWAMTLALASRYPVDWIRMAVVEALYQGRYKFVSIEQILSIWKRRSRVTCHFNCEFEALISIPLSDELQQQLAADQPQQRETPQATPSLAVSTPQLESVQAESVQVNLTSAPATIPVTLEPVTLEPATLEDKTQANPSKAGTSGAAARVELKPDPAVPDSSSDTGVGIPRPSSDHDLNRAGTTPEATSSQPVMEPHPASNTYELIPDDDETWAQPGVDTTPLEPADVSAQNTAEDTYIQPDSESSPTSEGPPPAEVLRTAGLVLKQAMQQNSQSPIHPASKRDRQLPIGPFCPASDPSGFTRKLQAVAQHAYYR